MCESQTSCESLDPILENQTEASMPTPHFLLDDPIPNSFTQPILETEECIDLSEINALTWVQMCGAKTPSAPPDTATPVSYKPPPLPPASVLAQQSLSLIKTTQKCQQSQSLKVAKRKPFVSKS